MPKKSKRQDTILHDTLRPVVLTTNVTLQLLFNTNRLAFNEFVKKCRNPEHRMSGNTLGTCQGLSLMKGDSVHEMTKNATLFLVDTPGSHYATKEAQTSHHEAAGDDAQALAPDYMLVDTPNSDDSPVDGCPTSTIAIDEGVTPGAGADGDDAAAAQTAVEAATQAEGIGEGGSGSQPVKGHTQDETPLISAVKCRNIKLVESLLDRGADVNEVINNGHTALTIAAQKSHKEVVKLLLDRGANVNHVSSFEKTALMYAASDGDSNIDMVRLLIENGADVNAVLSLDQTPFEFVACKYNAYSRISYTKILTLLLKHGAEPNRKNKHGETPFSIATRDRNSVLAEFLQKATRSSTLWADADTGTRHDKDGDYVIV